jgi:hypothetical protein
VATTRDHRGASKERPSASEAHTRTATPYRPSTRRYEARSLEVAQRVSAGFGATRAAHSVSVATRSPLASAGQ